MARHFIAASNQRLVASPAVTAAPLTMAAWIKSTDGTIFQRPLALGGGVNNEYFEFRLRGDAGATLEFVTVGGGLALVSGASTYTPGVWFHMCGVVRSTTNRELYKNGASVASDTSTATAPTILNMTIGILGAAGGFFNPLDGDMAEVGFWRVALTPKEVQQLAAGAPCDAIRPSQLVAYPPLDQDISDRRRNIWTDSGGSTAVSTFVPRRRVRQDYDANVIAGGGTVTGDGSSAGTGTATGVGAATAAGDGLSAGTGVALGVGTFTMAPTTGVGSSVGTGTAAGVGAATAAGIGNAAGLGTALGVGASIGIISAVGNAAGTSTALGTSPQLLGGGEAGRGAKGGRRRKRIEWLPADYDIETGEPRVPIAAEPAPSQPPSVQLTKGERKVARLLAQYRGRDDDVAERAREQLEALRRAEDSVLARFMARQQALDTQRRAAAAIAAEDDEAVVAFMRWMMSQ